MSGNQVITFESKQIVNAQYNYQSMELTARYFTGEVRKYEDISLDDYLNLMESTNKYDCFVRITSRR